MATPALTRSGHCKVCNAKDSPSRCAGCKVTWYCSKDHQTSDWTSHIIICTPIKKARVELQREETDLRASDGVTGRFPPGNPFETAVGQFWGYLSTRPYMRARYVLIDVLKEMPTHAAVSEALDHILDILRLNPGDNMGIRDLIPALYLRLGKDQEAYDFMKWYAAEGRYGKYEWSEPTDLPFLNHSHDALEPVNMYYFGEYAFLVQTVAATLLKIKVLDDLRSFENAALIGDRVPREILDCILEHIARPVVARNAELMQAVKDGKPLGPYIERTELQIDQLYRAVAKKNSRFWPALLSPGADLMAQWETYSEGSEGEMQRALQYGYAAWAETPGAIEVIRAKRKKS